MLSFPNTGVQSLIVQSTFDGIFSKLVINITSSKSLTVLTLAPELSFEHRARIETDCFAIVIIRRADPLPIRLHNFVNLLVWL